MKVEFFIVSVSSPEWVTLAELLLSNGYSLKVAELLLSKGYSLKVSLRGKLLHVTGVKK